MRSAAQVEAREDDAAQAPKLATKRAAAQGTKPKAKAGSTARKAAAPKTGRPATKTERTSSSQRRAAGSAGKERKGS